MKSTLTDPCGAALSPVCMGGAAARELLAALQERELRKVAARMPGAAAGIPTGNAPLPEGAVPLRERLTVAEQWTSYRADVLSPSAPDVQIAECRRAFYAGAAAYQYLTCTGLDRGDEATDLDIAYMEFLFQELVSFKRDVLAGRA